VIETFRNAWRVPELRKKLLFTFFIIIIYRVGGTVPVPYLDSAALSAWFEQSASSGDFFSYLNVLSGGNFSKATLLALSVSPYINAQIIIQLLTYALPPLERLQQDNKICVTCYCYLPGVGLLPHHEESGCLCLHRGL